MAFDQPTRNRLQKFVGDARALLSEEFTRQLQNDYGLDPNTATISPLENLGNLDDAHRETARILRETLGHYQSSTPFNDAGDALKRIIREQAFTVLNRLTALRMAESRGILIESVGNGYQSRGFQLYERLAGPGLGETGDAYRCYLFSIFDEFALDLKVLFDRFSPQGRLFPRETALMEVLKLLNDPELAHLWAEDETIGWVYQYFNSKEERKKMRDESAAPRNSRELAVRNQFFTPRYVVQFLTDNTLGRIWYEMTQGETGLKGFCCYLVRRPVEIFLKQGESAPEQAAGDENLSQEELLRQPVYIGHRPLKDPRIIRMLDPACGSMHFGLYAFDLYEKIYQEAWELEQRLGESVFIREAGMKPLTAIYPDKDTFMRDVPRLIIECNIHGIDIDQRAVQIAGLSLWLRAQRSWHNQGVKPADRPRITRSNIICAEPMPGEDDMRREFTASLKPRVLGQIVDEVFEKMKLAGEAGSLLKIEEEIKDAIAAAKKQWGEQPKHLQLELFSGSPPAKPAQMELRFYVNGITDKRFWDQVEDRILDALKDYAEQAENGRAVRLRLFVDDAVRGFAFIDLCRKHYDVVLMNPPFGDASLPSKPYIEDTYGDTKGDIYKAFVECFNVRLVPASYLGIISSRTGFFLGQSEDWRTRVVLRLYRPITLADLGSGVLDAMVEVAAYVLRSLSEQEARDLTLSLVPTFEKVIRDKRDCFSLPKWQSARGNLKRHQAIAELEQLTKNGFVKRCHGNIVRYIPLWHAAKKISAPSPPVYPPLVCVRALADEDKNTAIANAICNSSDCRVFIANPSHFTDFPGCPFAYWAPHSLRHVFRGFGSFESKNRRVRQGGVTGNDTKYLRAWWEVPVRDTEPNDIKWVPYAKGGNFSPFFADIPVVVRWDFSRCTFFSFIGLPHRPSEKPSSADSYFSKGLTWPLRAHRFAPVPLPSNSVFSIRGYAILSENDKELLPLLAVCNSSVFDFIFKLALGRFGFPEFVVGILQQLPLPTISDELADSLALHAQRAWSNRRDLDKVISTSHAFRLPALLNSCSGTLAERAASWADLVTMNENTIAKIQAEIDGLAFRLYGLDAVDRAALNTSFTTEPISNSDDLVNEDEEKEASTTDTPVFTSNLIAYALGCAFGRWDIRFSLDLQLLPTDPKPFDPLPVCSPGMLLGPDGLPAEPNNIVSEEWLCARPDANTLPPPGMVKNPIIPDSEYPLRINWSGILVDDESHPEDIASRIREVIEVIWKEKAGDIEHEACEILGVKSLRDYFAKSSGFFADHLKRYSKSRRQAPVYWPLSTPSGIYTLWIYYHRLNDQTLYTCVMDFVEPKLLNVANEISRLRQKAGSRSRAEEKELETLQDFEVELKEFRDELLRLARLPWKPDLNDGVQITAAPLWKLFQLPKWKKTLKETGEKLEKGDYDWAHLAYSIWPDRVREKCRKDKSLAIAHDLEELYEEPPASAKKMRGKKKGVIEAQK